MKLNSTLTLTTIITGCINGDRYYQQQLYNLYAPKLYPVCLNYFNTRQQADEELVNLFISIYSHLPHFDFTASFEIWAIQLLQNSAKQRVITGSPNMAAVV